MARDSFGNPSVLRCAIHAGLEFVGAAAKSLQPSDRRLDGFGFESQLFDQSNGLTATTSQPAPRLTSHVDGKQFGGRDSVVAPVPFQQGFKGLQVVSQPAEDLRPVQLVGRRHLHRAIKADFSIMNSAEQRNRFRIT